MPSKTLQESVKAYPDNEFPSAELEEVFEHWNDIYSVDNLTDMTQDGIESQRLLFENEVERLKAQHDRGRLCKPSFAVLAEKKPYTRGQLEEARQLIKKEADCIRVQFRQAKGIVEKERKQKGREFVGNLISEGINMEVSLFNIS